MNIAYLIQSFLILLWWIGILQSDKFYKIFEFQEISKNVFECFLFPDFVAIALLSLVNCYAKIKGLNQIITGAFLYATLFCFSATLFLGGGEISSLLMFFGLSYNLFLTYQSHLFRSSKETSPQINLAKTIVQIVCIWSIFLLIIPYFILRAEGNLHMTFELEAVKMISIFAFCLFSLIGLWSGYTLTIYGEGTPLPFDATNKLVINGPYSYIRNPMAVCGIGQGIAIAMLAQSFPVFVYCLLGLICWNWVIRKIEEADLTMKYGEEYIQYCQFVKCWVPLFPGYHSTLSAQQKIE